MGSSGKKALRAGLMKFGAEAVERILSRSTVQSTLRGQLRKLVTGSGERFTGAIPEVEQTADRVVEALRGRIPEPACIGIDGIAGAGKSSLARSLSGRLGLRWQTLYARDVCRPLQLQRGVIYENLRLFRTQDLDAFDALVYIDAPLPLARERVLQRDRAGTVLDFFDFEKLKRFGDAVFEAAEGDTIEIPDSFIKLKIRPAKGFRNRENLAERLVEAGLEPGDLCREEMLFLLFEKRPRKGIRPYVKLGAYNSDLAAAVAVGVLAALRKLS
jgi:hypothetical protein